MESILSEAQKEHIKSLPSNNLLHRIGFHKKMIAMVESQENKYTWVYSYHVQMLEYTEKVYAERILVGDT